MNTFSELNLPNEIIERLNNKSINQPTPVQTKIIPLIQQNKNILFQSDTGTGKTLAYVLPLIEKIPLDTPQPAVLIIAPTHELSSQIKSEIQTVTDLKAGLFIGSAPLKRQIDLLKDKPRFIIGGAYRIIELIRLKKLKTDKLIAVIFDEADRLLSPELRDATEEIFSLVPQAAQIIACSATMNKNYVNIFQKHKDFEVEILPTEDIITKNITHLALFAEQRDKIDTLRSFLIAEKPEKTLVFTSKVDQVDIIVSKLMYKKINCYGLHAKTDKVTRKQAIDKFKNGKCNLLITSDLAARGLDIQGITHIIQMDFPSNEDFFIHRAGRTARAGKKGVNLVIGDSYELQKYARLEKKLGLIVYPKELHSGKLISPEFNEKQEK